MKFNPYKQVAKDSLSKKEEYKEMWKSELEEIKNKINLQKDNYPIVGIYCKWEDFCPYKQYVTIDALDKKDWDNGIFQNSIYVTFSIDFCERSVEINSTGHVWISPQDKELYQKDKYLAMHSMREITKRNGAKVMRKSGFKNIDELVKKMLNAYDTIMTQVIDYTGGYPYKEGIKALKSEK